MAPVSLPCPAIGFSLPVVCFLPPSCSIHFLNCLPACILRGHLGSEAEYTQTIHPDTSISTLHIHGMSSVDKGDLLKAMEMWGNVYCINATARAPPQFVPRASMTCLSSKTKHARVSLVVLEWFAPPDVAGQLDTLVVQPAISPSFLVSSPSSLRLLLALFVYCGLSVYP